MKCIKHKYRDSHYGWMIILTVSISLFYIFIEENMNYKKTVRDHDILINSNDQNLIRSHLQSVSYF